MISDNHRAQTMAGGWDVIETTIGELHNVPCQDYKPHSLYKLTCWCHPKRAIDAEEVVIHNSMDRREFVTRLH